MPVDVELIRGLSAGKLTTEVLKAQLLRLEKEYSLVQSINLKEGGKAYISHPMIRDSFRDRPLHREIIELLVQRPIVSALLERVPSSKQLPLYVAPANEEDFDELEELIRHMLATGRIGDAWALYQYGFGMFANLGARLGLFSRGERLARLIAQARLPNAPVEDIQATCARMLGWIKQRRHFLNEWGIFAFSLGQLRVAMEGFAQAVEIGAEAGDIVQLCICSANLCEAYALSGYLHKAVDTGGYALHAATDGVPEEALSEYSVKEDWLFESRGMRVIEDPHGMYDHLEFVTAYVAYVLALQGLREPSRARFAEASAYFQRTMHRPDRMVLDRLAGALAREETAEHLKRQRNMVQEGRMMSLAGVYHAAALLRWGDDEAARAMLVENRLVCQRSSLNRDVARCDLLLAKIFGRRQMVDAANESLHQAHDWALRTGDQDLLVWCSIVHAQLTLNSGRQAEAREVIYEGLRLAEYCGYGLHWVDLQVVKGQWELACGRRRLTGEELPPEVEVRTPQQWSGEAEDSALRALNGQLRSSDDPASQQDLPEEGLGMLGARHPECGYAWGEGDALHLLGEARLALAECVGPEGEDSRGRSFGELVQQARQAGEEAVQLRTIIQDPNAKETQSLLKRIQDAEGGDGP